MRTLYFWIIYIFLVTLNLAGLVLFYAPHDNLYKPFKVNPTPQYIVHILVSIGFAAFFYIWLKGKKDLSTYLVKGDDRHINSKKEWFLAVIIFLFQIFFFAVLFWGFDGVDVVTRKVYRGEWRASFGLYGPIVTVFSKFLIPANFILFCALYFKQNSSLSGGLFKTINLCMFFLTFLSGMSLGGKTSAVYLLMGGLIITLNKLKLNFKELVLSFFTVINLYFASSFYFDNINNIKESIDYGISRILYIQTEPIGLIYSKIDKPIIRTMPYYRTLIGFVGNQTLASVLEVEKKSVTLLQYNFSKLTTFLSYPKAIDTILLDEYNVTVGVFIEGVLALGKRYFFIFSAINGLIAALLIYLISLDNGSTTSNRRTVIVIVYFLGAFVPWTNSGGIVIMFHVVTVFSMIVVYGYLLLTEKLANMMANKVKGTLK